MPTLPPIWNVPHHRNPNFTGRESLLIELRTQLTSGQPAALTQAISGLGGVGKTQLAVEYVYRYITDYSLVWWVRAEEAPILATNYAGLAQQLELPEKDNMDQEVIVTAVRQWLTQHAGWLLVFDNVRHPESIIACIPQGNTGHVLITSRNPNWRGVARSLSVRELESTESVVFLGKRTGQADKMIAAILAEELGNLPLALEQAGAYMEETSTTLVDYLKLFRSRRRELWNEEQPPLNYPDTVATTWSLAIEEIYKQSPSSVGLLNLCAYLGPDDITRTLLSAGKAHLPEALSAVVANVIAINRAIATLRRYSLVEVTRDVLSVHRLVQAVVRDRQKDDGRSWAEAAVRMVNDAFPFNCDDVQTWPVCERLLSHALTVARHAKALNVAAEARGRLLNHVGLYLLKRAEFGEAEIALEQAVAALEQARGSAHLGVAASLNNLALLYHAQGRYAEAEPLYQRALTIWKPALGLEHPSVATGLNNLAELYYFQGRYAEGEALCQQSLTIRQHILGPGHPDVATSLNILALLYYAQGRYTEAEEFHQRALTIRQHILGPGHPDVATSLSNLAWVYCAQGRYTEAEDLDQRALTIRQHILGPGHPDVAINLYSLAGVYYAQGRYIEAEPLYQQALTIWERGLEPAHPDVAACLYSLAGLYSLQGRYAEAEPLYQRALTIWERVLGPDDPAVTACLHKLAGLYYSQGRYAEAEALYQLVLTIQQHILGPEHPNVAVILNDLAQLYCTHGHYAEAEELFQRALTIWERELGPEHPNVATSLNNLAQLYCTQSRYAEAEPLCQRALTIRQHILGPEHPDVANSLNNLAGLYYLQSRYTEAEPLYQQALTIWERKLGPEHPTVVICLENYAALLRKMAQ